MNVLNCWAAVMIRFHSHLSGLFFECQHITSVILPQWILCKGTEAISSLITPEIEDVGTPTFLSLLTPTLKAAVHKELKGTKNEMKNELYKIISHINVIQHVLFLLCFVF